MRLRLYHSLAALGTAFAITLASGCNLPQGFEPADIENRVRLVQQPWEDLLVENAIAEQILTELGYHTSTQDLSVPLGAQALAQGDADAYLGNWWPSQEPVFEEHLDSGKIEVLDTLVTGTTYAPAVPQSVVDEYGVNSLADLEEKKELFGGEFLGIENGSPGNQYILDAIEQDAYDLGDWELIESGTAPMLAEVERRMDRDTPVVFLAWNPHWMNVEWDVKYLDDPEEVWPGAGEIRVATREGLAEDDPNLARFLSQMQVEHDTASDWIYQVSKESVPPERVARDWIDENPDTVEAWLEGVETVDGEPAEMPHD